jgi:hypothetical protein
MNIIRKIAKQELLLKEEAGISFIVRRWAKILKAEVESQLKEHKESELAKIKDKSKTEPEEKNFNNFQNRNGGINNDDDDQLEFEFPEEEEFDLDTPIDNDEEEEDENSNDPFYWKDESGRTSRDKDWDDYDEWEGRYRFDKKADWRDRDNENSPGYWRRRKQAKKEEKRRKKQGGYLGSTESQQSSYGGYSGSYGGYYGGGYGGYNYKPQPYIPPLDEVVVYGDSFPDEYKEFSVDMWVMKNSSRIEYDHYESGYAESGEYVVYLNVPLAGMSETAFVHEIKHAYDDWNRMRHGGKPIRDTWEIKNIYTKDFEKMILGAATQFPQLGPIVRNLYLGSKLEQPAYLENEYDGTMVDYEGVGRKLMNFKASSYLDKRGNPANGLAREFESIKRFDIPLFKKFKSVVEFLYWVEKYFNKRGKDIFKRVAKMRYVHGREKPKVTTYTPSTYKPTTYYTPKEEKEFEEGDSIGNWKYTKALGWHEVDEEKDKLSNKFSSQTSTKVPKEEEPYEEGETIGDWKYSKDRGWYFAPDEEEDDFPY